jgi:protein gp37
VKDTAIEWTDHSWSPWRGCTKVSPGCANCYAETLSKRNPAVLGQWGKGKPRVLAKNWGEPVKWNRNVLGDLDIIPGEPDRFTPYHRPTVFPSLCDWLDDEVPAAWLARFLQLIHDTPNLTWLLLTKRPELWRSRIQAVCSHLGDVCQGREDIRMLGFVCGWRDGVHFPRNVWVGTSVEDQIRADERIPALLKIPAVARFLSVEPLLGPVEFTRQTVFGSACMLDKPIQHNVGRAKTGNVKKGIHWVIIGGESGHGARPCNVEWVRSLVRQCKGASVPAFVKQLGAKAVENGEFQHTDECFNEHCELAGGPEDCQGVVGLDSLCLAHPKGGDPSEWPEDLRVREFPEGLR